MTTSSVIKTYEKRVDNLWLVTNTLSKITINLLRDFQTIDNLWLVTNTPSKATITFWGIYNNKCNLWLAPTHLAKLL
jgi:hypothetical protein